MLMTVIKKKEALVAQVKGKVFVVTCFGCKEVNFFKAEEEAEALFEHFKDNDRLAGVMHTDYICNPGYFNARFDRHVQQIAAADTILVFSCGVGVQTLASCFEDKQVVAACDTYRLPGFQGVTPLEYDCRQCGQCYLNLTGGICPITACSKSLINGQCGGAKNGKCEVDSNMDCGWERIYRRLEQLGRLDVMKCAVQLRDYATGEAVSE